MPPRSQRRHRSCRNPQEPEQEQEQEQERDWEREQQQQEEEQAPVLVPEWQR